jgi:hypothetical protein
LRINAWTRMPAIMLNDAVDPIDESHACLEAAVDPDGELRSWTSGTVALINNSFAARVDTIATDLADSFVEQGWEATTDVEGGTLHITLVRPSTLAQIDIESTKKDAGVRAKIAISVTGPCVKTAGAESDEVKLLEGEEGDSAEG